MKMIKYLFIFLTVLLIGVSGRAGIGAEQGRDIIVRGNNRFALGLYAKLRESEGNLFFSPYSISTALAMTYAGARGQTQEQMAEVLDFPTAAGAVVCEGDKGKVEPVTKERLWTQELFHCEFGKIIKELNARSEKGGYQLTVANALWSQAGYEILKDFQGLIETNYDGGINEVDFIHATEATRQKINSWVERKTNERIKDLMPRGSINDLTRLVLANAIYFKGNWASQFDKRITRNAPFTLAGGEKIDVAMMNQTEKFGYMETESFRGLEMPYVDNDLSMIIFLPKRTDGLADFEKTLVPENLSKWLDGFGRRRICVSIPKFTMTERFSLNDVLKSMGMRDAFLPETVDFSGINGKRELFISAVAHKAFVTVDEEGTEAAAATGISVGITSMPPVFRADRPFLFLIRDNITGSILFIGRLMDPRT